MLHRHWSLYDAFTYSSYVAPRLQTWRQLGRDNLQLLFAHMGIKLEHAKLHYSERHAGCDFAMSAQAACQQPLEPVLSRVHAACLVGEQGAPVCTGRSLPNLLA